MSQEAGKKITEAAPEPASVTASSEPTAPTKAPGAALPAPPEAKGVAPTTVASVAPVAPVAPVQMEYVIQPNTIIELVDLYVPPAQSEFRFPSFQQPEPGPSTSGAPTIRGRRRGRPPLGSRPTGIPPRKPYRRRRKAESPPPLPPVPNYLAHVINPLENEIYPKVIVQPARLPWVIPKNLNEDHPPAPPPPRPQPLTEKTLAPVSGTTMSPAQLCQSLKLFGPDVTVTQVTSHGQSRFLAVLKEPNGQQRHLLFSANQLQSFLCSRPVTQMGPPPLSWQRPPPPGIVRLRPGPTPRRGNPASQSMPPPPPPPPPVQPPRVIVEPPPNFRLPTMAALRASAQEQARLQSAGMMPPGSFPLGSRVLARSMSASLPPGGGQVKGGVAGGVAKGVAGRAAAGVAAGIAGRVAGGFNGGVAGVPGRVAVTGGVTGGVTAEAMAKARADQEKVTAAAPKEPPKPAATPAPPPRPRTPELPIPRMPSILTRKSQLRLLQERAKRAAERQAEEAKKLKTLHAGMEPKSGKENELFKW